MEEKIVNFDEYVNDTETEDTDLCPVEDEDYDVDEVDSGFGSDTLLVGAALLGAAAIGGVAVKVVPKVAKGTWSLLKKGASKIKSAFAEKTPEPSPKEGKGSEKDPVDVEFREIKGDGDSSEGKPVGEKETK